MEWIEMAVIFNNLVVNAKSKKFRPFLFNLLSGRRRILDEYEFGIIRSILSGDMVNDFDGNKTLLIDKLVQEKQFITDEQRLVYERTLLESGQLAIREKQTDSLEFTIELTRSCNMSCQYCYMESRRDENSYLTEEHIDAIYAFYSAYAKTNTNQTIGVTGGEPLLNNRTVDMINYIEQKWPESKIILLTNCVNALKYYDMIPLKALKEVHISLDGTRATHMSRRYYETTYSDTTFDDILEGIKRFISDGIKVKLKTVIDKFNYRNFFEFEEFLLREGVANSSLCEHEYAIAHDFSHPLDLRTSSNEKADVFDIREFLSNTTIANSPLFLSAVVLYRALGRKANVPMEIKAQRCNSGFLSNYYFSCDGNVYFCGCVGAGKGTVGTYYPNITLNEEMIEKLRSRSIVSNKKCWECMYKYVCLGGCPLSATDKGAETSCGIFGDEEIMDNLEFNYHLIHNPQ